MADILVSIITSRLRAPNDKLPLPDFTKYVWQREESQEYLYNEVKQSVTIISSGNLNESYQGSYEKHYWYDKTYTGRKKWGVVPNSRSIYRYESTNDKFTKPQK